MPLRFSLISTLKNSFGLYLISLATFFFAFGAMATSFWRAVGYAWFWILVGETPKIQPYYKIFESPIYTAFLVVPILVAGLFLVRGIKQDVKKGKFPLRQILIGILVVSMVGLSMTTFLQPFAASFASSPTNGPIGQSIDTGYGNSCSASFCLFSNYISGTQFYYSMAGLGQSSFPNGLIAYGGPNNAGAATGTNFTQIINDAILALPANGGTIHLSGTFTESGGINLNNADHQGIILQGDSTQNTIISVPATQTINGIYASSYQQNAIIEDLQINGNGNTNNICGIGIINAPSLTVRDTLITGFLGKGTNPPSAGICTATNTNEYITNSLFQNDYIGISSAGDNGLIITNNVFSSAPTTPCPFSFSCPWVITTTQNGPTTNATINGNYFIGNSMGVRLDSSSGSIVSENYFEGQILEGVSMCGGGTNACSHGVQVIANHFEWLSGNAIGTDGANNGIISDNTIYGFTPNVHPAQAEEDGICVCAGSNHTVVSGNNIQFVGTVGMTLAGSWTTVVDNVIGNVGQNTTVTNAFGIVVYSGNQVLNDIISNNIIFDDQTVPTTTGGIWLFQSGGPETNVSIMNNQLLGHFTGGSNDIISISGSPTNIRIIGNFGYNPVASFALTACASVCTITNNYGYTANFILTTVGGITAESCNGISSWSIALNTVCELAPRQSLTLTWATTAPVYTVQDIT